MKKSVYPVLAAVLMSAVLLFMVSACNAESATETPEVSATVEPIGTTTPVSTPEPTPEPTSEPTPAPTLRGEKTGLYYPGEYTAKAIGFDGYVFVTITVDDNSITDVQITGDEETPEVGGVAIESMPDAIMEAQSSNVDGITGASFTSAAIIEALDLALAEAKGE